MVNYIVIFMDGRGSGGISFKIKIEMWFWFGVDFCKRLEVMNVVVKEIGGLCIQFVMQFIEVFQCQYFFGIDMQIMCFQQCGQCVGICGIEVCMYVVNIEIEFIVQYVCGVKVSGDY